MLGQGYLLVSARASGTVDQNRRTAKHFSGTTKVEESTLEAAAKANTVMVPQGKCLSLTLYNWEGKSYAQIRPADKGHMILPINPP